MIKSQIIDLTWPLISNKVTTWDVQDNFTLSTTWNYSDCNTETKFHVQKIACPNGSGTHIDAPLHCFSSGKDIASLSLTNLIAPLVMIEIKESSLKKINSLTEKNILDFEEKNGKIDPGSFVLIKTGWGRFWSEPEKYRNSYRYPHITINAAKILLDRGIVGLGIDTLSPDCAEQFNEKESVHTIILGANKYIVENVCFENGEPDATGSTIGIFPLKIENGTESPVRLIAWN